MSLSIQFTEKRGQDGPFHLASASGWNRVHAWVHTLPVMMFQSLYDLTGKGEVNDTQALSGELKQALRGGITPPGKEVLDILTNLQGMIGVGDEWETVKVVDEDA